MLVRRYAVDRLVQVGAVAIEMIREFLKARMHARNLSRSVCRRKQMELEPALKKILRICRIRGMSVSSSGRR